MMQGQRNIKLNLRLSEDHTDALRYLGGLTIHKMLLIYICCAVDGLDNKLYIY